MKYVTLFLLLCMFACGGGSPSQSHVVTPPPPPEQFTLSMTVTGSGSVSSAPAGIACPGTCSAKYDSGTTIVLTETPTTGNDFSDWSGTGCAGTTSTCAITLTADESPSATFSKTVAKTVTLAVGVSGGGTVTSSPAGINCPGQCSASYVKGTSVALSAVPASGATFTGWSGACKSSTTNTCDLTLSANAQAALGIFTPTGKTPPTFQVRFSLCTNDGTPSYVFDTDLDQTGTGGGIVYEFPTGCPSQFPWDAGQPIQIMGGLGPMNFTLSSIVNYLAPNFIVLLGSEEVYQGICNQSDTFDCLGTFSGNGTVTTVDQPLTGSQFQFLCTTCTYTGMLEGIEVSLTFADNTLLHYTANYQDVNGTWDFAGVMQGGTGNVDDSGGDGVGDPALADLAFFVVSSNSPTSPIAFYDGKGNFQGSLSPGAGTGVKF
jgi:hypothetical protein